MTWLGVRQFRAQAAVLFPLLAALVVLLAVSARTVTDTTVYAIAWASVVALPGIIGVFWGAPLLAREFETGTYRLAWTQSVTRTRWLATKLAVGTLAAMAAAALLTLAATWWARPIDAVINAGGSFEGILGVSRMEPQMFLARGIAPIGYAAFAFVLGVTAGLVLRRTVPAMAVTLVVYVAVQIAMPVAVRSHFGAQVLTTRITQENLDGLIINDLGDPVHDVRIDPGKPGAWVTSNAPVDRSGRIVDTLPGWVGYCVPAPGQATDRKDCFARLARAGYRQRVSYLPAGRYWRAQAIEMGTFLVLAAGLAGVCCWRIRRVG